MTVWGYALQYAGHIPIALPQVICLDTLHYKCYNKYNTSIPITALILY